MKKNYLTFVSFVLCALCQHNASAQFNFKPFQTYPAVNTFTPESLAVGDFNNDGKPDIATADPYPSGMEGIFIFNNNGDGTFATPDFVTIPFNNGRPVYVSVGDLNGDTYPDIVTSNSITTSGPHSIAVLLNNGTGGFEPPDFYVSGANPGKAVIQDFNGDNKPDIVVANVQDTFISMFINNGDGSFAPQVTYFNGYAPSTMAADIDNDGKMDLIVRSSLAPTTTSAIKISVMLNDGSGNFATSSIDTVDGYVDLREVADLNNDTKPDLIVGRGSLPNGFLIYFNNGNSSFGVPVSYNNILPHAVVAIDMNQDGKKDLVMKDANFDYNYIYLNNGNGVLAEPIKIPTRQRTIGLCVLDLDGDNKPDFVNGAFQDSLITVTLQKGSTSIHNLELKGSNISLFPNPGKNMVTVLSSVNDQLKVYDLLGRLLIEQKIVKGTNRVDISGLSPSLYTFVAGAESIKFEKRN